MYEGIVQELIDELGRLPGIGPKSAQRIAFHIVQTRGFDVSRLGELLIDVRDKVRFCSLCGNVADEERCSICRDPRRNRTAICVVEEAKDVAAIEIRMDHATGIVLLHDPGHSLDERIIGEQFG